jgi:hypothetical protein
MKKREEAYKKILDRLYPGLVIRKMSDEVKHSYGLVLSAESDVRSTKGIPLIDYYHEAECLLNDGYQTGDLYDMGVSYEFVAWIDKHPDLHFEWENPAVLKLYIT